NGSDRGAGEGYLRDWVLCVLFELRQLFGLERILDMLAAIPRSFLLSFGQGLPAAEREGVLTWAQARYRSTRQVEINIISVLASIRGNEGTDLWRQIN